MIASLIAFVALCQGQEVQQGPTAGELITKMLGRYGANKDCKSLFGKITLVVSAGGESSTLATVVQFEKPSLVLVRQVLESGRHEPWTIVSDGKHFSYNRPETLPYGNNLDTNFASDRLVEAINQGGALLTIQDIFQAAGTSLKDRSLPLDLAFGRSQDLRYNVEKWASHDIVGQDEVRGKQAYVIGGLWREYGRAPASDRYRMWVTSEGDLLRYEISGVTQIPDRTGYGNQGLQKVVSVWEIDMTPNAPIDRSLFRL